MTSKNPFGQLTVRRDEDDEEVRETKTQNQPVTSGQVLFSQNQNPEKKKKKVRPEEKKKSEEQEVREEETDEGFSVVGKKKVPYKPKPKSDEAPINEGKEKRHEKNKGAYLDRNTKQHPGKRVFERHSGTGRGKEVAKGGAGGKHTWGDNPKNVARKEEEEYNEDEDVFNYVLNAKPRPVKTVEEKENVTEEPTPKVPEKVEEEVRQEPKVEEERDDRREGWDKRKKKKGVVEEKKEDLLERPDNALSYSEYLEQLKQKNQSIPKAKPTVNTVQQSSDLKPQTRENDEFTIGASSQSKKQKPKTKERTVEGAIEAGFKVETGNEYERRYDNKENRNFGNKKKEFHYNPDEFPEL